MTKTFHSQSEAREVLINHGFTPASVRVRKSMPRGSMSSEGSYVYLAGTRNAGVSHNLIWRLRQKGLHCSRKSPTTIHAYFA